MRAELTKNSLSGVAQFLISTVLVFITIPAFVRILGPEAYGVFSLVSLAGSVNIFANLGLNASLVRCLSQQGKTVESDHDIILNLVLSVGVLIPVTVFAVVFRDAILLHVLSVPVQFFHDAEWLFLLLLLSNVFVVAGQAFTGILDSLQKIYLTNLIQAANNILYWAFILGVLLLGYSLASVGVAILASTLVWFSMVAVTAYRAWGGLSLQGLRLNALRAAKKQLRYGVQIYAGGLVGFFYEPFTKILVSRFFGVNEVGVFDIGLRARNLIMGFAGKLVYPLFPILSRLDDTSKVRSLVHDVEQKTFLVVMPIVAILVITIKPITTVFFYTNVDAISITVASIVSAYLLFSFTVIPIYQFLIARGYASRTIVIQAINVLFNAVAFFVCLPFFGYFATVIANAIAILASWILSLYYQKRYVDSLIFDSVNQVVAMTSSFLIAFVFGYSISAILPSTLWKLVVIPVQVILCTALLYRSFSLLTADDIFRYLGNRTLLSRVSIWILCKG